ncbi:AAA family ATPase [Xanthobacter sp. 126]|uniref:AAA family ATPase n=1 Tax=Xanthobacter sp. 126 TaxID=1131814 RepID=UPI0004B2A513|nr:AAA family ATPase [Xanthobacter sp. 126]
MAKKMTNLEFDENVSFDINLEAFKAHITKIDSNLASELCIILPSIINNIHKTDEIWNLLLKACEAEPDNGAKKSAGVIAAAGSATPPAPQQSPLPTVTGWLLEGVSIEGFRGVNNEGQPLELKFNPNTVSSVSAVNGVGKTSVYDAVRYAITGTLPWLDDLPATERESDYYHNRFHSTGQSTIKLRLVAEPGAQKCEITVVRSPLGQRTVSATGSWDAQSILTGLDREFVFLDGPTFQKFIAAPPLSRGRTFSGLLGLSAYSDLRQALASLSNTRAFNNHFETTQRTQAKMREERASEELSAAIAKDYDALIGAPLEKLDFDAARAKCHEALVQIAPLKPHCEGKEFNAIDIDGCIDAIKDAEGGPKRERLGACIRMRDDLSKLNHHAPTEERAKQLAARALERDDTLAKTAGDLMLQLYQAGTKVIDSPDWEDPHHCPLCDREGSESLKDHRLARGRHPRAHRDGRALTMAMSRINPRRIHMHLPYTVEQVADALKVHKNTVRLWIKQGLPVADTHRPVILAGADVRTFLLERRAARKHPTGPGRFYCFRCRESVRPAGDMADLVPRNDRLGALQGLCPRCGALMHRAVAMTRWRVAASDLDVKILQGPSTPKRDDTPHAQS